MATNVTIGGNGALFVGEDKSIRLTVLNASGIPVNISGWNIVFDVRYKDTSSNYIISITATIAGVYNVDPILNTQYAFVDLTDDIMNLFIAKTYRHSWKRQDAGNETVLARRDFKPEKATAP